MKFIALLVFIAVIFLPVPADTATSKSTKASSSTATVHSSHKATHKSAKHKSHDLEVEDCDADDLAEGDEDYMQPTSSGSGDLTWLWVLLAILLISGAIWIFVASQRDRL